MPHSSRFVRLVYGSFYCAVLNMTFYEFIKYDLEKVFVFIKAEINTMERREFSNFPSSYAEIISEAPSDGNFQSFMCMKNQAHYAGDLRSETPSKIISVC